DYCCAIAHSSGDYIF
nr:immunoglobulin light chain junction region [Macaca mulatta]